MGLQPDGGRPGLSACSPPIESAARPGRIQRLSLRSAADSSSSCTTGWREGGLQREEVTHAWRWRCRCWQAGRPRLSDRRPPLLTHPDARTNLDGSTCERSAWGWEAGQSPPFGASMARGLLLLRVSVCCKVHGVSKYKRFGGDV